MTEKHLTNKIFDGSFNLHLGNSNIEQMDSQKLLGLTIDRHLSFNAHVEELGSRATSSSVELLLCVTLLKWSFYLFIYLQSVRWVYSVLMYTHNSFIFFVRAENSRLLSNGNPPLVLFCLFPFFDLANRYGDSRLTLSVSALVTHCWVTVTRVFKFSYFFSCTILIEKDFLELVDGSE